MIEINHSGLSLACQCELVRIACSSYCYRPKPENEFNLELMRLIDEQYLKTPWYLIVRLFLFTTAVSLAAIRQL